MKKHNESFDEIKFKDIRILIELLRAKSVRELSRSISKSPGQLTKIIQNFEKKMGKQLVIRSQNGIRPTPESYLILPLLEELYESQKKLMGELTPSSQAQSILSFASASYISTHLLPKVLGDIEILNPIQRIRIIDLPPSQFIKVGLRGGFQICVHMDEMDWPKTWTSVEVGIVEWSLFCRTDHPLGNKPTLEKILKFPFIYPVYWSDEGLQYGNDGCQMSIQKRILGHETGTAASGVEIVANTNQIGFFPNLVAENLELLKIIKKIQIPQWKPITKKMFLTVKNDLVKQSLFLNLKKILNSYLK